MTELELRKMASAVQDQFKDPDLTDEQLLSYIKETPELINAVHPSGANLFLTAVSRNRFSIALALSDMEADVHWMCEASLIHGNALNVARSPEQLLGLGIEIEKSLSLGRGPYRNPAGQKKRAAEDPERGEKGVRRKGVAFHHHAHKEIL